MEKTIKIRYLVAILILPLVVAAALAVYFALSLPEEVAEVDPDSYQSQVSHEQAVIAAVEKASPAVVSIVVTKQLPIIERCRVENPFGNFFSNPFSSNPFDFYTLCERGTRSQEIGGGSGFIVSSDGLIVSNRHVVDDSEAEYTAILPDGRSFQARVVDINPVHDLAVLDIEGEDLPTLEIASYDQAQLGQSVIAIGNALGEYSNTVSVGIVSGLSRNITTVGASGSAFDGDVLEGAIQTDAAINRGNSGGPLINLDGEVIGVNTAVVAGAQNIGFAIPAALAKRDVESVEETGEIQVPFLGVRFMTINPALIELEELAASHGALVRSGSNISAIAPGSPAEAAGILDEDIIVAIDGEELSAEQTLTRALQRLKVGQTIELTVLREAQEIELVATLSAR